MIVVMVMRRQKSGLTQLVSGILVLGELIHPLSFPRSQTRGHRDEWAESDTLTAPIIEIGIVSSLHKEKVMSSGEC